MRWPISALASSLLARGAAQATIQLGKIDARITGNTARRRPDAVVMRWAAVSWNLVMTAPCRRYGGSATVETFDLTGPLNVSARASGTLADPLAADDLASDESAAPEFNFRRTDIDNIYGARAVLLARGRLIRFAGTTDGAGPSSAAALSITADMSANHYTGCLFAPQ
jgi:translocation and assembly module TamB